MMAFETGRPGAHRGPQGRCQGVEQYFFVEEAGKGAELLAQLFLQLLLLGRLIFQEPRNVAQET